MSVGTGKGAKMGLALNSSVWETGAAEACIANSGMLVEDSLPSDTRPIISSVSLGQDRPSSWVQQAIQKGGDFNKKFRFGGKMHQLFAGALGVVDTVSYRSLTKIVTGTATGGSTVTLVDSGAPFGADDLQIGKYLIINTGTGIYQVLAITDSTSDTLTFATATAPLSGDTYEVVDFGPAIFDICDGTATSTTVTVTKNTSMGVNAYAGKWITITTGTGIDQTREIVSNTADTFTVLAAWDTTPDATSVVEVMGDACTHIYEIGDTEGIYFTKTEGIAPYIKEIPHLKIGAFEILGTYDGFIMTRFTTIGDQDVVPATVNTDQTLWTIRQSSGEIPMKKTTCSILMNRATGSALATGTDDRKVNEFAFRFEQAIEGSLRTGPGGNNIMSEPIQNAHPAMSLNFTEPLTEDDTLISERNGNYAQKASLTLTGAALNANQNAELVINMPNIALNEVAAPINDPGFVVTTVTSSMFDAAAAPSGMSYTEAFKLEITDGYGGNPIQAGNT
ncbi:MAG: hypothetical protein KAS66_00295 [Candidatus Omnitrophica bacterium]|nr:hypothetical protein [Candidatus Omnitrophota bacterium]